MVCAFLLVVGEKFAFIVVVHGVLSLVNICDLLPKSGALLRYINLVDG